MPSSDVSAELHLAARLHFLFTQETGCNLGINPTRSDALWRSLPSLVCVIGLIGGVGVFREWRYSRVFASIYLFGVLFISVYGSYKKYRV
jgi:hypothetical protein